MHLLAFLAILSINGCATMDSAKEEAIFWPEPPEEPKIAYVRSYSGKSDFSENSFLNRIFGKPYEPPFRKPSGVFAVGNKVYVTLTDAGSVAVIDPEAKKTGDKLTFFGDQGKGKLATPLGITGARDGSIIFVADTVLKRVMGYDATGKLIAVIGKQDEFVNPVGVAVNDELGRLYVLDGKGHNVQVYSLKGEKLFQFGEGGQAEGNLYFPYGIAIDRKTGNVYITDTMNFRVMVFDKEGKFLRKIGELGDIPGTFSRPKGIGIDSEGHLYVSDAAFGNVQIFDESGALLMFIGGPGAEPGSFQIPAGIYVDKDDRIYVADSLNRRVQVFQYLSDQWKKENPEEYKKYLPLPEVKGQEAEGKNKK